MQIKYILRILRNSLYFLFNNLFYLHHILKKCNSQLNKLSSDHQIFFITRDDFGIFLITLLYIQNWQKKRGNTCLVILTPRLELVKELASIISPETKLVFPNVFILKSAMKLFRRHYVQSKTLVPAFAQLINNNPNSILLYDHSLGRGGKILTQYISHFDESLMLEQNKFSSEFSKMYIYARKTLDYRKENYVDCINLYYQSFFKKPLFSISSKKEELLNNLKIIGSPYVMLNLKIDHFGLYPRRGIRYPERFNCIIDALIEKGYAVVIQGREEQPFFKERKGLIDYARSPYSSVQNDLILYSDASFAISSKTGVEIFSALCQVPLLGLNYVELTSMQPNIKMRYYPKHVVKKKTNEALTWEEFLKHPAFFEIGELHDPDIECVDLEEVEMMQALQEFLPLTKLPDENWLNFTSDQKKFKEKLSPLHLDLYYVKSVPCDCYLKK